MSEGSASVVALKAKILLLLSGSIACYKTAILLSRLIQAGFDVQTVATASALKFIGEATLEGLSGKRVLSETFASGEHMQHIHLVKWADLIVLAPATANTVNKFASGIGDDLLSTLFLAHDFKKPFLLAPAMNTQMYFHPATRASLTKLRKWGVQILEPGAGLLACGDKGEGRMLEPDDIFNEIKRMLTVESASAQLKIPLEAQPPARALKILVSSGGTREAIDGVRAITNTSTGKTGAALAEHLVAHGHDVTFAAAQGSAPATGVKNKYYVSFSELNSILKEELRSNRYDAILHLAAVSDYSVDHIEIEDQPAGKSSTRTTTAVSTTDKLESDLHLAVHLKPNAKIVDHLREYSANPDLVVVAFKLTNGLDENGAKEKITTLLRSSKADFVVHNDLAEISNEGHRAKIYNRRAQLCADVLSKSELADQIENLLMRSVPDDTLS